MDEWASLLEMRSDLIAALVCRFSSSSLASSSLATSKDLARLSMMVKPLSVFNSLLLLLLLSLVVEMEVLLTTSLRIESRKGSSLVVAVVLEARCVANCFMSLR